MSDNIMNLLDTIDVFIKLLYEKDERLQVEQIRFVESQRKLATQYAINEKLLKERNALKNKLALIEMDEKCSSD